MHASLLRKTEIVRGLQHRRRLLFYGKHLHHAHLPGAVPGLLPAPSARLRWGDARRRQAGHPAHVRPPEENCFRTSPPFPSPPSKPSPRPPSATPPCSTAGPPAQTSASSAAPTPPCGPARPEIIAQLSQDRRPPPSPRPGHHLRRRHAAAGHAGDDQGGVRWVKGYGTHLPGDRSPGSVEQHPINGAFTAYPRPGWKSRRKAGFMLFEV